LEEAKQLVKAETWRRKWLATVSDKDESQSILPLP